MPIPVLRFPPSQSDEYLTLMDNAEAAPRKLLKIFPPIWALIFLGLGLILHYAIPSTRLVDFSSPMIGGILILASVALNTWAWWLFQKAGTEIEPTSPSNRALVTTGPYRITRNPMYFGFVLLLLGIAFCVGSLPMLLPPLLFFFVVNVVFVPFEEAKMARQFGEQYAAYKRHVRRWL
jgi:protein-S-isoprenylcysteine O-methyltransferase Ste14